MHVYIYQVKDLGVLTDASAFRLYMQKLHSRPHTAHAPSLPVCELSSGAFSTL